ncbi:hypothetical protein HYC85_021324 [Camellia sinensis]|uniref:Uncharacterized protein n=1 Tax=Camellia sinensis TaxID=4442 RepID=A0A7J7GI74_CAMSI|nr:hypothetical protein HYC85_021324 [Camellia sinensis]
MKEKGKAVETYNNNYSSSSDLPCPKHPFSSSIGICAHCLKERLINLVCSDCGEQRLSSCSCSGVSSYPNSYFAEVGSVGRISFLIENETKLSHSNPTIKRSNSSCVGIVKKRSGFWRIGRLFRKKREKGCDERSEMWMFDHMSISRSRSLCGFRGGSFYNDPEEEDQSNDHQFAFSSAKISDSERMSGFSETENRKSGLKGVSDGKTGLNGTNTNKSVFPVKESDLSLMEESGFIDLKIDLSSSSESKPEFSVVKKSEVSSVSDLGSLTGGVFLGHHECCEGSFGISVNGDDIGIKKDEKGYKAWRWIFKHHLNWKSSATK